MNINANIETAGTVREKVKSALGFDCASALDLVRREDFANEEAYTLIQFISASYFCFFFYFCVIRHRPMSYGCRMLWR